MEQKKRKCGHCGYKWKPSKEDPVSCPRCKRRFDYPNGRKDAVEGRR